MNKTIKALLLGCMGIQSIAPATVVLASEEETNKYEQAVADAQNRVNELEAEKTELESQVSQLKEELKAYDEKLDADLKAQVGTEMDALNATIKEKISQLSKQISDLNDTISSTITTIDTLKTAITKNTGSLKTAKTNLQKAADAIEPAQQALDKAEATKSTKETAYNKAKKDYDDAVSANSNASQLEALKKEYDTAKADYDKCDYFQGIYGYYTQLKEHYKDNKDIVTNITKGEKYLKNHTASMQNGAKTVTTKGGKFTFDLGKSKINPADTGNSAHIENVKESLDYMKQIADKRQADTTKNASSTETKNIRLLMNPWLMATSIRNVEAHRQLLTKNTFENIDTRIRSCYGAHLKGYDRVWENMDFSANLGHDCVEAWFDDELNCYIENGYKPIEHGTQWNQTGHYLTIMDPTNVSFGGALSHYCLLDNKGNLITEREDGAKFATEGDFYIQHFAEEPESKGSIPLDEAIDVFNTWYTTAQADNTNKKKVYDDAKKAYDTIKDSVAGLSELETKMNNAKKELDTATTVYNNADKTLQAKMTAKDKAHKTVDDLTNKINTDKSKKTELETTLSDAKKTLAEAKKLIEAYKEIQGYLAEGTYKIAESNPVNIPDDLKAGYETVHAKATELYEAMKNAEGEYQTKKAEQVSLEERIAQLSITMSDAKKVLKAEQTKLEAYKQSLNKVTQTAVGNSASADGKTSSKAKSDSTAIATGVGTLTILAPVIVATTGLGMVKATSRKKR